MEEEWDADDFEPKSIVPAGESKWADEDVDDDVKDNWEDEDEEEKKDTEKQDEVSVSVSQAPKKSKKNLAKKIEEKERQQEVKKVLTPEEKLAEKLRQQKLQEEADLLVAKETFGICEPSGSGLDAMNPNTKEDFDAFNKALSQKILLYSASQHFPAFIEEFVRNISVNMNSLDIKKLKTTIENLQIEKAKIEKGDKAKKNKGKSKAKLRIEGEGDYTPIYGDMDGEYDDFM